jgi:hypothetical protein
MVTSVPIRYASCHATRVVAGGKDTMRETLCGACGRSVAVEYGHVLRHGVVGMECAGSMVMVSGTYDEGME